MKANRIFILLLWLLAEAGMPCCAQAPAFNFHKLEFSQGLHDGIIRCIAQDKYGFIWIGSVGAINRFDGTKITQYTNIPGDTTSPYATQPRSMHADESGRFWIGSESGLMEYDFKTTRFKRIAPFQKQFIVAIESISDSTLLVCSRSGIYNYNTKTGVAFNYTGSALPRYAAMKHKSVNGLCKHNGIIYIATSKGLVVFNIKKDEALSAQETETNKLFLLSVSCDSKGNIWMAGLGNNKLAVMREDLTGFTLLDNMLPPGHRGEKPEMVSVLADQQDRIWLITSGDGLLQYHPESGTFTSHLHNTEFSSGPSSNGYRYIFEDVSGLIWLGCDVEGVNYFDPDQHFFTTVLPFPEGQNDLYSRVGRGVTVDKSGNIWMGNHDGLTRYDPVLKKYTVWRNAAGHAPVLYNNVIRTLYCDDDNNVWIGTSSGVNRYVSSTGKLEFIERQNLPLSFYNSINGDRSGNVWFCTTDSAALYWYNRSEKKYNNITHHPQLAQYARIVPTSYVLEDHHNRLWISLARRGVIMLDKTNGTTRHYQTPENGKDGIIGNQVIDIKEDMNGLIWITCFNGVTAIDPEKNTFTSYNNQNGLPGNMAAPVVIDSMNRVWIGVNGGLTMISNDRKELTVFSLNDGLSSVGFPEHAGMAAPDGTIIMPTYNGYFLFDPAKIRERKNKFNFYISGYSVFDKDFRRISEPDAGNTLHLNATQNSFTFYLTALNYSNPSQSWFAYRLDGFEKDWHYTKDPKAVYTNVPGGNYTFIYKAASHNRDWNDIPEKMLAVKLKTVFYKTKWFLILVAAVITALLYTLYSYRTRQQRRLYELNEKAQSLEKEKAMVMYENLKQQLNPHFLFNSLTSLNSLITAEPKAASEFLDSLSKTYRYILKSRDNDTVPLIDEVRFAMNYVKLQKTRFEKGFDVQINIPEELNDKKIAPVTLQNLIENAIKHNIIDEESPLLVKIFTENDYLIVKNNLQKKKFVETSNRQGLANMESLYHYLGRRPVEILETAESFIVKIPLL